MVQKSLKLNFLYNMILNISKVAFPLITAPYIARVLEPDGVGLFNFANTYAGYFALFAALGFPMYGIREIAKLRNNQAAQCKFVSEILSITIITTLLFSVIFIISTCAIPKLNENFAIFLLSALVLYTTPFRVDWFFGGKEEFGYIAFRSLLIKTVSIICLFLFVKEKNDLINYVIINACSTIFNEIWNFIKLYKAGIHPYFTLSGVRHLKPAIILFASVIAASVYTFLDTIMLGFMTDYSQVGYYNSALHISKTLLPIVTSLATVAMPRLSFYFGENNWTEINDLVKKSLSVVSFLCFPITFAVIAIAPTFVPLFYGEHFKGAILPLQIIICVVTAIGFSNLFGIQILTGIGKDKYLLYTVLIGAISNFLLNICLIPNFGANGAAIASVSAETLVSIAGFHFVKKNTPITFSGLTEVISCALVSSFFFPIYFLLKKLCDGWFLVIAFTIVGTLFYLITMYLLKNRAEYMFFQSLKKRIKK